jgi:ribosomal protein S18 acetylase RimI-like enzyme
MIKTAIYYLNRLGLVFKRGYYFFYFLDCSRNNFVDSATKIVEIQTGEITSETVFGWLTVDEARSLIKSPTNRMFLLQEGGESVASCWLQIQLLDLDFIESYGALPERSAYVTHVVVKPEFRAEGFAQTLLSLLVQALQQEGIEKIFLCVDHRNVPMQKVVLKLGFVFYFGIRYSRALFVRRYFIQNEVGQDSKWQRITHSLPPNFHLIDIFFGKSRS